MKGPSGPPKMLLVGMSHNPGGTELFMMSVFRALQADYEVWFLAVEPEIAFQDEILESGGRIAHITSRERNPFRYAAGLLRLFRNNDFAVLWMNQSSLSSIGPLLVAFLVRVPVRIVHSHQSRNIGSTLTALLHRLKRPLVQQLANRSFACSTAAARWFFGRNPHVFIPNAFAVERFTFNPNVRRRVRRELGLNPNTIAVTHVASFNPYKNHRFTLEVLEALRARDADVRFLYCGDGPGKSAFERELRKKRLERSAILLGVRSDVDQVLQASDVSVLPSISEGLPYTALEAQAAQLPVILSSAVGPEAALTDEAEFLSLERGPDAWADRILGLAACSTRTADVNPLRNTLFDSRTFRETLLSAIASGSTP